MTTNSPAARPARSVKLATHRLVLRPTTLLDADRAFEILSDWNIARMLLAARFPPSRDETALWFAGHEQEWLAGKAYRFAVQSRDRMIGVVDIDAITDRQGNLGYWLEKSSWGNGYALEAAQAVVGFAFGDARLVKLRAGHAVDNPASGRVLLKLGFQAHEVSSKPSRSRGKDIMHQSYSLTSAEWDVRWVEKIGPGLNPGAMLKD